MTQTNDIEQLFRNHYRAMYSLGLLILRDAEAARDIVHDVFESLLNSSISEVSEAYLLKAVRHRCLNYIRHLNVRERIKEMFGDETELIEDEQWPDEDVITLIKSTVANDLSEACSRVVNMRFGEGKSYREIADGLEISEVAVYKHLRHAINVLRQKLSQNG